MVSPCLNTATVSALLDEGGMEYWICEDHYAMSADRFVRRSKPSGQ